MSTTPNQRSVFILTSHPKGLPDENTWKLQTEALPELKDDEILIKISFLSVDPYMRGRMNGIKTYTDPFVIGKPINGGAVANVVKSKSNDFKVGDVVSGQFDWTDYQILNAKASPPMKLPLKEGDDPSIFLSVAGITGLTAYCGLIEIGQLKEGDVVVLSGAGGATGSVAGSIAKLKGCKVIGIAGSEDKAEWLKKEVGFDVALNYKDKNFKDQVDSALAGGVDLYFDNVGGEISDLVYRKMKTFGRIVLCGSISTYNLTSEPTGPRFESLFIGRRLTARGFIITDHIKHFGAWSTQLLQWVREGKIVPRNTILNGLENVPRAFLSLFDGSNTGKMLVKL